jgi:tRNA uridine 5-carboxymethylaminomethyl modification enzyme
MQGPRAQIDRKLYKEHMQHTLLNYSNLDVRAGSVFDLVLSRTALQAHSGENIWATVDGIKLGPCFASFVPVLLPLTHQQTQAR